MLLFRFSFSHTNLNIDGVARLGIRSLIGLFFRDKIPVFSQIFWRESNLGYQIIPDTIVQVIRG